MNDARRDFTRMGFFKTYVLPGVSIFLIPVLTLLFFLHAQALCDGRARDAILANVATSNLSPARREQAVAFAVEHPYSELIQDERFAADVDSTTRFYFATFRWMIRLSALSIVAGVAMCAVAAIGLWLSRRSQRAQYLSLAAGWQVMRIYGALQAIAQGVMVLALSFWVTALWMNFYSVKLVGAAGLVAAAGTLAVVMAIFKKPRMDMHVEGKVLAPAGSPRLWEDLGAVCEKVGTAPPDNVIVGVDSNFFVTETPVHVDGSVCRGRTLYVSLALLKQMAGAEAEAVLAHEMAHFSGDDTLYSRKISPLLARYGLYLQSLSENPIALPVYFFMNGFRALFELSRGEQSRSREFRADRIAAEATSPRDLAAALLRISAYAEFRGEIQQDLFSRKEALEAADISARIERGFHEHAMAFAADPRLGDLEPAHPFDTHPPLAQRLEAVGVPIDSQDVPSLVASPGDGRWYDAIDAAEEIERGQWREFEERFRDVHEVTLAYRLLPETDEERAIVAASFPDVEIEGKKGSLSLACDSLHYSAWPGRIAFAEVLGFVFEGQSLLVSYTRGGRHVATIPTKTFGPRQAEAIQAVQAYYGRYLSAASHCEEKPDESQADTV
ncbi:M48 family metallopeptidase [Paludisphaera mucosa]|uniref:M48 family metallopeptidase n=1 Tax=Paludisphaera mucosa TaxID=3030827 RepID=A0ABT6FCL8_9BACT|nr:M48 family metallopeptidase [Paludisphaera mucosa]MDG3005301.1 M48 family metallopeptidase [Paludisphaera mucosa]